jgi:hypothetical protein
MTEAAETLVLKLSEYRFSLGYLTNTGRLKSPQILPNQSDTPWLMEIIIQATVLCASNLFTFGPLNIISTHTRRWNFSFSRITTPLSTYLKFGHRDANTTEAKQCMVT